MQTTSLMESYGQLCDFRGQRIYLIINHTCTLLHRLINRPLTNYFFIALFRICSILLKKICAEDIVLLLSTGDYIPPVFHETNKDKRT